MNFTFPKKHYNPDDLIKRCGYGEIYDRRSEQVSYKRAMGASGYPRFHVYLKDYDNYFEVSLHLDQKKASYAGTSAHSGEYDGEQVENEARRITAEIAKIYGIEY